jgi:type IV pilus assembly protein PilY1
LVDSANVLVAQSTVSRGLITDLGILSSGGKIRLVAGDSSGGINSPGMTNSAGISLKRLNWREVPTVD